MRPFALVLVLLLVGTLCLAPVLADNPITSPLTNLQDAFKQVFGGSSGGTYVLPWYPVQDWEIQVCTRGLSTNLAYDPKANRIVSYSISSPIYTDTVTLLAKRIETGNLTYYEVGWYVQPFTGSFKVNVTLLTDAGETYTLASGTASQQTAFDGYKVFPVPCDPAIYNGACLPVSGNFTKVRLDWKSGGQDQYLLSRFVKVNETNQ